nr:nonstructural protein 1 [Hedgehog chapparvovirus 1]
MAAYHPFGNSFVDNYDRYTQFILEIRLQHVSILEGNNNAFLEYDIRHPKTLSLKYNKYKVSSFVISTDVSSYNTEPTDFLNNTLETFTQTAGIEFLKTTCVYVVEGDILGIIEHNESKGWHLHLLFFHRQNYTTPKYFESAQNTIFDALNTLFRNHEDHNVKFVNVESVKSVGSMLNYIKKDPWYLICNSLELAQMFVHFDRKHIFPEESIPKFTHQKPHTIPVSTIIDFFTKKLQSGCIDFEQALQDNYATNFLGNRNLKELFENTRTHYLANRKFSNAIDEILIKFLNVDPWYKKCICPIIDYLKIQNIDVNVFESNFRTWLLCKSKKNTLALIGPPDTGKSVFLSSLHNNFRFANRLATDGIFTFANTLNADCVYHEEPFIGPETAETAKLVYEGNPNSTICVKNRGVQRLNKKIPVLITSNNNVYQYCSGQRSAFDARMFIFRPSYRLSTIEFCDSVINRTHVCCPLNIDIKRRAHKSVYGDDCSEDFWKQQTQEINSEETVLSGADAVDTNCSLIHKLHKNHWRAFIFYVIIKYNIPDYMRVIIDETSKLNPDLNIADFSLLTLARTHKFKCLEIVNQVEGPIL